MILKFTDYQLLENFVYKRKEVLLELLLEKICTIETWPEIILVEEAYEKFLKGDNIIWIEKD